MYLHLFDRFRHARDEVKADSPRDFFVLTSSIQISGKTIRLTREIALEESEKQTIRLVPKQKSRSHSMVESLITLILICSRRDPFITTTKTREREKSSSSSVQTERPYPPWSVRYPWNFDDSHHRVKDPRLHPERLDRQRENADSRQ